ncbi:hypothetical protein AVEN_80645-1 [Araneus ventricosus]|uniref:Uncharacterized protein n=1 Tax=Araneus ventricosus TaxID=182803 RepID=A0A4Y2TN44_ARAVE|nr:hypothetical protein AVEN_80645-1 [Araneus ventricosus]
MAYLIDMSDISREREFATGCLVWIIRERNPDLWLEFLNAPQQNEDSDEEPDQSFQVDINQAMSSYGRIYEAINTYAVNHIEVIEAKYRSFFTVHRDLADPHIKNFMELVSRYAYGLYEKPFTYEIIIVFCAHLSVFGYMSYQAKGLQEVVKYAISSITYMLKYYGFDNSKYTELRLFAENFF